MSEESVSLLPGIKKLIADKGYDTDEIRAEQIQSKEENPPRCGSAKNDR